MGASPLNTPTRVGSILAALAFSIAGCDPAEPSYEGEPERITVPVYGTLGPAAPPAAVIPSPVPSLPSTSTPRMNPVTQDGPMRDESKPNNKIADPEKKVPR